MGLGSFNTRRLLRLSAVAVAISVSVAGAAACGDDEPAGTSDAASVQTTDKSSSGAPDSSATDEGLAPGPALGGDRAQAQAGLETLNEVYINIGVVVDLGLAATDVPVRQTLDDAADDDDLAQICGLMSEDARRQTIVYVERSAGLADVDWTCETATALLLRRSNNAGNLKRRLSAEVVGVNAKGNRATASVRFGRKIVSIPLVKEDGAWKLAASLSGPGG